MLRDELGEGGKLLTDELDRLLIGDTAGFGIDALRAVADEDFRFVESESIKKDHRPP
jgi:hypothetical protein